MIRCFFNSTRRFLIKKVGILRGEINNNLWKKGSCNKSKFLLATIGVTGFTAFKVTSNMKVYATSGNVNDDREFMGPPITDIKKLSEMENDPKAKMELLSLKLQAFICNSLNGIEREDKINFTVERSTEKGFLLCYQEEEEIFEKVSIEVVNKAADPSSCVIGIYASIYPKNPNIPSLQFNLLYKESTSDSASSSPGTLSGQLLMVPYVYNQEDFQKYHLTLKKVCDKHCRNCYAKLKELCDENSQLQGRAVGIGGISLPAKGVKNVSMEFLETLVFAIIPLYTQLVIQHKDDLYTYKDRMWQLETRSRQILNFMASAANMNPDSCFVHLPPMTKWCIDSPKPGVKQEQLIPILEKPIQWA